MGVLQLIGGCVKLANLYFKAQAEGKAVRYALAMEALDKLEAANIEDIEKASAAHAGADSDPNVGRL